LNRFCLYAQDEILGWSLLDKDDESMGIRIGQFFPGAAYRKYQRLFQQYSEIKNCNVVEFENRRLQAAPLEQQIESLGLQIRTDGGEKVGTRGISLADFSHDLGDDALELEIAVEDSVTYERFFGYSETA
jgi:hypothetical protein